MQGEVRRAVLLEGRAELPVTADVDGTRITLPDRRPDTLVPVVALEMDGDYRVRDGDVVGAEYPSSLIAERAACNGYKFTPIGWMAI